MSESADPSPHVAIFLLASAPLTAAAQAKFYRMGVILQGGPYYEAINGLRDGLREVGLEEGKHLVLDIRDAKGDLHVVEEAARHNRTGWGLLRLLGFACRTPLVSRSGLQRSVAATC